MRLRTALLSTLTVAVVLVTVALMDIPTVVVGLTIVVVATAFAGAEMFG